jgi:hypothetical protein
MWGIHIKIINASDADCWQKISAFPMKELQPEDTKEVIGLFDPSVRIWVKPDLLSFSIPWPKFQTMLKNMNDCFLNTYVREKIRKRLNPSEP